jgi:hypothetical protein
MNTEVTSYKTTAVADVGDTVVHAGEFEYAGIVPWYGPRYFDPPTFPDYGQSLLLREPKRGPKLERRGYVPRTKEVIRKLIRENPQKGTLINPKTFLPAPEWKGGGLYLNGFFAQPLLPGVAPSEVEATIRTTRFPHAPRRHNPGWPGRRFWWAKEADLSDWARRHRQHKPWKQLRLWNPPPAPVGWGYGLGRGRKSIDEDLRAAKESYYAEVLRLRTAYPSETAEQAARSLFDPEGEDGRPSGLLWAALGEREWGIQQMLGAASKGDPAGVAEGYLRANAAAQLLRAVIEAITFEDEPKKALRKALQRGQRYLVLSYLTEGVHHANKRLWCDPGLKTAGSVAGFLKGEEARRLARGIVRLTAQTQNPDDALLFAIYTRTHTRPVEDISALLEDLRKDIRALTANKGPIEAPVRGRRPAEVRSLDYEMVSEGAETSTLHDYTPAERTAEPEMVAMERDAGPARHAAALTALNLCRKVMSGRTPVQYEAFVARTLYDKKLENGRLARMSDDEVAEMLGISVGKFRNRLMDARKKLPLIRAALANAGVDLEEVPEPGYTIKPHQRGALKDTSSEHEPGEVTRFKASPERLERMGETWKLVPVRRSVDDWKRLGSYPTFATTFEGELVYNHDTPPKRGRTYPSRTPEYFGRYFKPTRLLPSARLPLLEGVDDYYVKKASAPDMERFYAHKPLNDTCISVRAPGRGRGYRDHRGTSRNLEAEEAA